jgi:hypothetical protein
MTSSIYKKRTINDVSDYGPLFGAFLDEQQSEVERKSVRFRIFSAFAPQNVCSCYFPELTGSGIERL